MHIRTRSIFDPRPAGWWWEAFSLIEMFSGIGLATWAAENLASPTGLNEKFFWPLLCFAPEWVWESIALSFGVFQILTVMSGNRWLRSLGATCAMAAFLDVTLNLVAAAHKFGNWPGGAVMLYSSFCAGDIIAVFKNASRVPPNV